MFCRQPFSVFSLHLGGEDPILFYFFYELRAMHFPALVRISNLILDFSLVCSFIMFLTLAKLMSDSLLPPAYSLRLAQSSWKLAYYH